MCAVDGLINEFAGYSSFEICIYNYMVCNNYVMRAHDGNKKKTSSIQPMPLKNDEKYQILQKKEMDKGRIYSMMK